MQTDDKGIVDLLQNVDLWNGELDLLVHDKLFLFEYL